MKYLRLSIIAVTLMFGLLSCKNSNDTTGTIQGKPVDTAISKTIVVDVRTVEEWINDGHADCSVNYPLDELDKKAQTVKAYDKVVVVCRKFIETAFFTLMVCLLFMLEWVVTPFLKKNVG